MSSLTVPLILWTLSRTQWTLKNEIFKFKVETLKFEFWNFLRRLISWNILTSEWVILVDNEHDTETKGVTFVFTRLYFHERIGNQFFSRIAFFKIKEVFPFVIPQGKVNERFKAISFSSEVLWLFSSFRLRWERQTVYHFLLNLFHFIWQNHDGAWLYSRKSFR